MSIIYVYTVVCHNAICLGYFLSLVASLFEITLFLSNAVFSGPTLIYLGPKVALHFLGARIATAYVPLVEHQAVNG